MVLRFGRLVMFSCATMHDAISCCVFLVFLPSKPLSVRGALCDRNNFCWHFAVVFLVICDSTVSFSAPRISCPRIIYLYVHGRMHEATKLGYDVTGRRSKTCAGNSYRKVHWPQIRLHAQVLHARFSCHSVRTICPRFNFSQ